MDEVKNFIIDFLAVFYEAMPFIVLGAIISGILEELVPQQFFARIVPKNRVLAIAMSALLGLVFPMCECGIVPVMRRLLKKGLPLGCCISYMLCGPIINGVVMASTWFAFSPHATKGGYQIIMLRALLGYVVAVTTACIIEYGLYRKHGNSLLTPGAQPGEPEKKTLSLNVVEETTATPKKSIGARLSAISETALQDFMDITIFLTIGSALAAISKQFISMSEVASFSMNRPALAILSMMGLAVVICLCSEADAFVAASFTDLHPSAKLAFLVLGPMLDLKLLLLFTRVFRRRLIIAIVICVVSLVFILTTATHYMWDSPLGFPSPAHPSKANQ